MIPRRLSPVRAISAVVSDVDGTLVTSDKKLTARTRQAVAALRAAGIAFAVISSRPPRGMRMLVEPLDLATPLAGFNGGAVVTREMAVIEQHPLAPRVARHAVDIIRKHGAAVWVFSGHDWLVADDAGDAYVAREEFTVSFPPIKVGDFGPALEAAGKVVAVSEDGDLLSRCEEDARGPLEKHATIARSQHFYLDFTSPLANKGAGMLALARLMGVAPAEVAVIGDGHNDIAMFQRAALSIAMGNADAAVKAAAHLVCDSNEDEGFAKAMEQFVLPAAARRAGGA